MIDIWNTIKTKLLNILLYDLNNETYPFPRVARAAKQCPSGAVCELPLRFHWRGDEKERLTRGYAARALFQDGETPLSGALARIQDLLKNSPPEVRVFGTMAFDPEGKPAPEWTAFGSSWFMLPLIEFTQTPSGCMLAVNALVEQPGDKTRVLDELSEALDGLYWTAAHKVAPPALVRKRDLPNRAAWEEMLIATMGAFKLDGPQKAVLARRSEFHVPRAFKPDNLLPLDAQRYFLAQPKPGVTFLGMPPEDLYIRQGDLIKADALAGTRPSGDGQDAQNVAEQELMGSSKDCLEHALVEQYITEALEPHTTSLNRISPPGPCVRWNCVHIHSTLSGRIHRGVDDAALLEALHPTPAVCGSPRSAALDLIRAHEPFARGCYAGPVGWISRDAAHFAVALRSALVRDRVIYAYAGAGIVEGSDPTAEWDELETKLGWLTGRDE